MLFRINVDIFGKFDYPEGIALIAHSLNVSLKMTIRQSTLNHIKPFSINSF